MKKKNEPIRSVPFHRDTQAIETETEVCRVQTMKPCATRRALSGLRPVALSGRVVTDPIITL